MPIVESKSNKAINKSMIPFKNNLDSLQSDLTIGKENYRMVNKTRPITSYLSNRAIIPNLQKVIKVKPCSIKP